MTAIEQAIEYKELHTVATTIFESDLDWERKYDLIFSDQIIRRFKKNLFFNSGYYDPDESYEADVKAFMEAVNETIGVVKKILHETGEE